MDDPATDSPTEDHGPEAPHEMPGSWRETYDMLAACMLPAVVLMGETAPRHLVHREADEVVAASERVSTAADRLETWCIRLTHSDAAPAWAKRWTPELEGEELEWHLRARTLEAALASLYQERSNALDILVDAAQADDDEDD